ncbi:hypothetical protein M5K25_007345 [Dendrobium thyrsiflorum]|uniref:DUF4283 domain-containing protein n=1 Tax=Dendrobium thyrsiflorum TaxID=117978 RepID=A0ABD0VE51_DENTH
MAETDSSDQITVASTDVNRDNLQAPPYADEAIVICTLPETPCSSASTSSQTGRTPDPPSCNDSQPFPVRKKRFAVFRRRAKGAKIRCSDSDEEKRDDLLGKERLEDLEDESVNPSSAPDASGGPGDRKDGDGSTESMVSLQQQQLVLLDVVKMMCTKTNERFADTDILDIAAMKGICFPPPSWWKPGGYGAKWEKFCGGDSARVFFPPSRGFASRRHSSSGLAGGFSPLAPMDPGTFSTAFPPLSSSVLAAIPPTTNRNWTSMFDPPEASSSDNIPLSFYPEEPMTIAFYGEKLSKGAEDWNLCLVGYSIGKRPFYEALLGAIRKTWQLKGEFQLLSLSDGFFLLHFSSLEDFDLVWSRGVWFLLGKPFILQKWHPRFRPKRENFDSVPIWIKIHDFPLAYWNSEGISRIASKVGIPLAVDPLTVKRTRLTFVRVCVQVDREAKYPDETPISLDGDEFCLKVQYEWRPTPCDYCKSLTHYSSFCPSNPAACSEQTGIPKPGRGRSTSRKPPSRLLSNNTPSNPQPSVANQTHKQVSSAPNTNTSNPQDFYKGPNPSPHQHIQDSLEVRTLASDIRMEGNTAIVTHHSSEDPTNPIIPNLNSPNDDSASTTSSPPASSSSHAS